MQKFAFSFLLGMAGLFLAILILVIGFWKVFFLAGMTAVGIIAGIFVDRRIPLDELLRKWQERRRG